LCFAKIRKKLIVEIGSILALKLPIVSLKMVQFSGGRFPKMVRKKHIFSKMMIIKKTDYLEKQLLFSLGFLISQFCIVFKLLQIL